MKRNFFVCALVIAMGLTSAVKAADEKKDEKKSGEDSNHDLVTKLIAVLNDRNDPTPVMWSGLNGRCSCKRSCTYNTISETKLEASSEIA